MHISLFKPSYVVVCVILPRWCHIGEHLQPATIFYNTSNSGQIWFCRKPFQILTLLFYLNHQSLVSNLLLYVVLQQFFAIQLGTKYKYVPCTVPVGMFTMFIQYQSHPL